MDTAKFIGHIKKYRGISVSLGLTEDVVIWDNITALIKNAANTDFETSKTKNKKSKVEFQDITTGKVDLLTHVTNSKILSNKYNMLDFWLTLNPEEKTKFLVFELNVILYLIAPAFNKYQSKAKDKIISTIDGVVRDEHLSKAYKKIVV